jgi:hypothetical protein
MRFLKTVALAACSITAASASGQQPRPPVHPLGEIVAKSVSFDSLVNVRVLSDGRVVVNDILARRLVALDPSLTRLTLIADTSATSPHSYGENALLPYLGDSVVLLDFRSSAMVVIDPAWTFGRSMAMAKASDDMNIINSSILGAPAFDPAGRLVYRGGARLLGLQFGCTGTTPPKVALDSAPLVRANLESRTIDTLTQVKFVQIPFVTEQSTPGCWRTAGRTNVLPTHGDDWVVMTDGTIAIVREQDYHVDWIAMDGTRTSTPKMPFDWRQLTADDKQRMIDSATRRRDSSLAARPIPAGAPPGFKFTGPPVVTPDQIPDYYPALKLGSVKVDIEGNLWIPPSTSREAKGGVLYDVVNRKGDVVDRVQLPAGRAVVGFTRDAVLLLFREGSHVFIERARRK